VGAYHAGEIEVQARLGARAGAPLLEQVALDCSIPEGC
jgi:hypothetical protein